MTVKDNELTNNAGLGGENLTEPSSLDVEREPMPSRTSETDIDHPKIPPARSGNVSEAEETPTEGDPNGNPTHHTGHIPPPITAHQD